MSRSLHQDRRRIREELIHKSAPLLRASGLERVTATGSVAAGRRRRLNLQHDEPRPALDLVEREDGVLVWEFAPDYRLDVPRRRGRRGVGDGVFGTLIERFEFDPVRGSDVAKFLDGLDRRFNPQRGLRALSAAGVGAQTVKPVDSGRILLFIHGTFSHSGPLREGLTAADPNFFSHALAKYDQLLAFEHPTLSVSPLLNALDLARAFRTTSAKLDVICHSRGGLVARWWFEVLNQNPRLGARVIFVGSPLEGTSLAAPDKLRAALSFLTNVSTAIRVASDVASAAVPLFGVVGGLMRLVGSAAGVAAHTPLVDAAIAMIPGLAAQSRIGNNFELARLQAVAPPASLESLAIRSDFEPSAPGWAFWKLFMKPGERLADAAADRLFAGPNDLIVDTASMTALGGNSSISNKKSLLDFGHNDRVHHLNYFHQPETAAFIRDRFGWG